MKRPGFLRPVLSGAALWLVVAGATPAFSQSSGGAFVLRSQTVDAGGGAVAGNGFAATTTIGQVDAHAAVAGGAFVVRGGFWPAPRSRSEILFFDGFEP